MKRIGGTGARDRAEIDLASEPDRERKEGLAGLNGHRSWTHGASQRGTALSVIF